MTTRANRSGRSDADLAFANRLSTLCIERGQRYHGQQQWLVRQLGARDITVSRETASKWFAGTVPTDDKMRAVADVFDVDPGWLRYGDGMARRIPATGSATTCELTPMTFEAANRHLAVVVDNALRGKPTLIDRDGTPQAVVVGFDEWQRLAAPSFGRLLMAAPFAGGDLPRRSSVPLRSLEF